MEKNHNHLINEFIRPASWVFVGVFSAGVWCLASVLITMIF